MTEGVNVLEVADSNDSQISKRDENFRRLETARDSEREARIRAEVQNENLRRELEQIRISLQPKEVDPLDEVEDYVDPARLKAKLKSVESNFERKAEEIARKTYEKHKADDEKKNFHQRLKSEFHDFDEVMTPQNIQKLVETDPVFMEMIAELGDDYKMRQKVYKKLKSHPMEAKQSIKEKVEANLSNPYFIPATVGTPSALEFDLNSKSARESAYAKLKSAQRNPIGGGQRN